MSAERLEYVFPELRESEDERIRKELISFITDRKNWFPKEETKTSWIAWLEKQGEKKFVEWSEEDEQNLKDIINEIEANKNDAPDYDLTTYDRLLSWLKSLKPNH